MNSQQLYTALLLFFFVSFQYVLNSENSHEDTRNDNSLNTPDALLGYNLDICNFPQIDIACPPDYVVTEITTEYYSPGYCGCFRMDLINMAKFLKARCVGSVSCRTFDRELKIYDMYMTHPPGNCGYERRIRYSCEPAQSLCEDRNDEAASYYSSHVNLLSPDYPNSYPGSQRPSLVCATQLSVTSTDQPGIIPGLKMNVIQSDINIPAGEYVSFCHGDTLHIGATYEDLGPEPWTTCQVAGSSFQIETPLKIIYYYPYNPYHYRGALLKIMGVSPRSIIEVKYIDYRPFTTRSTSISTKAPTVHTTTIPPDSATRPQKQRGFQAPPPDPPKESEESNKTNTTVQENTSSRKHPYKGSTLTMIVVGCVVLFLLVFLLAILCLWRRRHSSWKSAMSHAAIFLGCKNRRTPQGPSRLSSRPSSGSTINPYAYSATTYPPANQYTEPLNVYVNTGNQRSSNSYRGNGVYDDVQAQRQSLVCKEPPYDNHIMVKALKRELDSCPVKHNGKVPVQVQQATSSGSSRDNVEDLYSKPAAFKRKTEDDGYDSGNSTSYIPLQEGENLLVENELYHSKNKRKP